MYVLQTEALVFRSSTLQSETITVSIDEWTPTDANNTH